MQLQVTGYPPRRAETLKLAAMGFGIKATANAMGCSEATVKDQRFRIMCDTRAKNITEAVSKAFQRGLLYMAVLVLSLAAALPSTQSRPPRPVRTTVCARTVSGVRGFV